MFSARRHSASNVCLGQFGRPVQKISLLSVETNSQMGVSSSVLFLTNSGIRPEKRASSIPLIVYASKQYNFVKFTLLMCRFSNSSVLIFQEKLLRFNFFQSLNQSHPLLAQLLYPENFRLAINPAHCFGLLNGMQGDQATNGQWVAQWGWVRIEGSNGRIVVEETEKIVL